MEEKQVRHTGTVSAVDRGMAVVRFTRTSACKHCGACLTAGDQQMEVRVKDTLGVKPGDCVEVTLAAKKMLTASALCYLMPLGGLLAGVLTGSLISELWALILGVALMACCFLVLWLLDRHFRKDKRFVPQLVKICEEETL